MQILRSLRPYGTLVQARTDGATTGDLGGARHSSHSGDLQHMESIGLVHSVPGMRRRWFITPSGLNLLYKKERCRNSRRKKQSIACAS